MFLTWTITAGMNKCCLDSFLERCTPAEKWKFPMQTILWGLSSETSSTYPGNMFPIWLHLPLTSSVMITGCKKLTMNQLFVFSLAMS